MTTDECFDMKSRTYTPLALTMTFLMLTLGLPLIGHANAAAGDPTLSQVTTGLVHRDPLTAPNDTVNQNYWRLFGDAPGEGAAFQALENRSGLYIGIQSVTSGGAAEWAGFYTESPNSSVWLFHTTLTLPYSTIPSGFFNTGMYVQTDNGFINYVTCAAQVNPNGYEWIVLLAQGNKVQATSCLTLYEKVGGPLTQSCTIVTNGNNMLKVYLANTLVYSSTSLSLNMPPPFNAYLEVESNVANATLWGKYTDYYATLNDTVTVQNVPTGDTAELLGSGNTVLGMATAGLNGTAAIKNL